MAVDNISDILTYIRGIIDDLQQTDGYDAFEYEGDDTFELSEDFIDSSSISVKKNGTDLTSSDWSFNSSNNRITISITSSGISTLSDGDTVEVFYSYFEKHSDAQIKKFVKSALTYFVKHRYHKTFKTDSNDNVVAVNDEDPTREEEYLIALVTSVLIDPQNINVRTPEFTLGATEDLSRSDQIANIFTNRRRAVGGIEYIEDPDDV